MFFKFQVASKTYDLLECPICLFFEPRTILLQKPKWSSKTPNQLGEELQGKITIRVLILVNWIPFFHLFSGCDQGRASNTQTVLFRVTTVIENGSRTQQQSEASEPLGTLMKTKSSVVIGKHHPGLGLWEHNICRVVAWCTQFRDQNPGVPILFSYATSVERFRTTSVFGHCRREDLVTYKTPIRSCQAWCKAEVAALKVFFCVKVSSSGLEKMEYPKIWNEILGSWKASPTQTDIN